MTYNLRLIQLKFKYVKRHRLHVRDGSSSWFAPLQNTVLVCFIRVVVELLKYSNILLTEASVG